MISNLREWVGLGIFLFGRKISRLGDWIGGWEQENIFVMGMRMGRKVEQEAAFRRERRNLPSEW